MQRIAAAIMAAALLLTSCSVRKRVSPAPQPASRDIFAMGTMFSASVWSQEDAAPALAAAEEEVTRAQDLLSWRSQGSPVAVFNKEKETDLSRIGGLLSTALDVCEKSGGSFDITVLGLTRLWQFDRMEEKDFDRSAMKVPEETQIRRALQSVGWDRLSLDEKSHVLRTDRDDLLLDLGAVGKGWAVDQALSAAAGSGAQAVLISAGSSIGLRGTKPDGSPFVVSLRDPRGGMSDSIGTLTLTDCCVSTSGDYERYFEADGRRWHHILDPHTGYPADSGLIQVTVICESGALGDALSTACFVLGLEKGMLLAKEYNVLALFVDKEKNIWYNDSDILGYLDFSGQKAGYTISRYSE